MSAVAVGAAGAAGTFEYVCDGTADEVQILAALADCGAGDTVALSAGTFACSASFTIPAGVNLAGTAGTILDFGTPAAGKTITAAGKTISHLDLRGPVCLDVVVDGVTVSACISRHSLVGVVSDKTRAAFRISPPADGTIENVTFEDCDAIDTDGFGFYVDGHTRDNSVVSGVTFRRCTATGCGVGADRYSIYVTGYDLAEGEEDCTIAGMLVEDCTATGCSESGFHAEYAAQCVDCRMVRCTSSGNGVRPDALYGAGFLSPFGWTFEDCEADDNALAGFTFSKNPVEPTTPSGPLALARCTATGNGTYGVRISSQAGFPLAGLTMTDCAVVDGAPGYAAVYLWRVEDAAITNLLIRNCPVGVLEYAECSGNTITYYLSSFAASPGAPYARQEVAFADVSANDGIAAWLWDFGDGETSALQNPAHAFAAPGPYVVTLAAGGNTVARTVTVRAAIAYGGIELSEADVAPLDHDPVANATDLHNGRVGLQGSPVSRRAWTINALADDHAEIDALDTLMGQRLTLNLNGVEYPGTMICKPFLETQLTPATWAYQIGFVQETRR